MTSPKSTSSSTVPNSHLSTLRALAIPPASLLKLNRREALHQLLEDATAMLVAVNWSKLAQAGAKQHTSPRRQLRGLAHGGVQRAR